MNPVKVLAIIPARAGSKGLPGKNHKNLCGKPLFLYSVEVAKAVSMITDVVVSTDCEEIINISSSKGVDVCPRPTSLATDDSLVIDAIRYTVEEEEEKRGYQYKYVILLEPTSPMRTEDLVQNCTSKLIGDANITSLCTYSETEIPPSRVWAIQDGVAKPYINGSNPWLPRQKHSSGYQLNGLYYGICRDYLKGDDCLSLVSDKHFAYITPRNISIDIDTEIDFDFIECLMSKKSHKL